MNALRWMVTGIGGLAAALVAYSALFVRGDLAGVMAYLRARSAARRLAAAGADAEQVAAAQANLHLLGQQVGDPAFAAQTIPLALLLGAVVGLLIWRSFGRSQQGQMRADVQERMVYRLAHRKGGGFTLRDLSEHSPLTEDQARQVTHRMLDRGRLIRQGEGFRLP